MKKLIIAIIAAVLITALAYVTFTTTIPQSKTRGNQSIASITETSPYIKEYSLPQGSWPNGILVDKNSIVWIAGSKINALFSFDPKQDQIKTFDIPQNNSQNNASSSWMVWAILQDNDGNIWFSQLGTGIVWRFAPGAGQFNQFHFVSAAPFQMKLDPDTGNIWYTTLTANKLGVIQGIDNNTNRFTTTEFYLGNNTQPAGLFLENNTVWVTEISNQKIVRYNILSDEGRVTNVSGISEFPSNNKTSLSSPTDLFVLGNSIWLTEHGTSFITKYQIDTNNITRYPTSQNVYHVTTLPFWMRVVNDGKGVWINEHEGNKIAYFDIANKTLTEYEVPSRPPDSYLVYPLNISVDPNDNSKLWFSEWNTDKIGVVDRKIPIPFDIHSNITKAVLSDDASKQVTINLEITKNHSYNNQIFLNASSSMDPAAGFFRVDASFTNSIDMTKDDQQVQLELRNYSAPPGNYTLGVSASDGTVTRTIFFDLVVP